MPIHPVVVEAFEKCPANAIWRNSAYICWAFIFHPSPEYQEVGVFFGILQLNSFYLSTEQLRQSKIKKGLCNIL